MSHILPAILLLFGAAGDGPDLPRPPAAMLARPVVGENGPVPSSATLFRCLFDEPADRNYDGWPDGWTRRRGPGFPQYIAIKIAPEPSPGGGQSLRVDLDGGGATAYSPPVPISALPAYLLEGCVKAEKLKHDRAWLSLNLLDEKRQSLGSWCSPRVSSTPGWEHLRLGPVTPPPAARLAVIGLHVEPEGADEDLQGTVFFGDLRLTALPRMTLHARRVPDKAEAGARGSSPAVNLFTISDKIEIACTASGLRQSSAEVAFQVEDIARREAAQHKSRIAGHTPPPKGERTVPDAVSVALPQLAGQANWQVPPLGPGFYRVRAAITTKGATITRSELAFCVIDPSLGGPAAGRSINGDFGWSLPRADQPLALPELSELLGQAGIHWVKYPMVAFRSAKVAKDDSTTLESFIRFSDRLNAQGMEIVGVLNEPGPDAFADPKTWYPALEPLQARLATQIRYWQLGGDRDTAFLGIPALDARIAQVKKTLDQIGQGVSVGMAWDWTQPLPGTSKPPAWQFLALYAPSQMTDEELAARVTKSVAFRSAKAAESGAKGDNPDVQRWLTLEPLPKEGRSPEDRAEHLVKRMVAAKIHGAEAIFAADPFNPQNGLIRPDGTPGELFLPWRTAAIALGGTRYLGSLDLPGGSTNHLFARQADLVMVAWGRRPAVETIYLGDSVQKLDLWGRAAPAAGTVPVEPLPVFLVGLSEPIVRWHIGTGLGRSQLPCIPNQPHANSLGVRNSFAQAVTGRAVLTAPQGWRVEPQAIEFRLGPEEKGEWPLEIMLPPNVMAGPQSVQVDFEIHADRDYHFGVSRQVEVGLGDVRIETATRINAQGELEVEQAIINQGKRPVSFRCELLVPDRRREATLVVGLPPGRGSKVYRLPDGKELLGKALWLRAAELDGPRVLNYRLVPSLP